MKNKKLFKIAAFSLGTAATVIAPVASVVACGTDSKSTGGATANSGISLIDAGTKLDQNGVLVPNTVSAYSAASLRTEAKKLGHASAWVKGPTYHAVSSFVSFADQLAEAFGYSTTKDSTGKTQLEKDNKDQGVIFLGDQNHQAVYDAQTTKTADLMFLNSLKGNSLTDAQKSDLALVFGDNDTATKDTLNGLNVASDTFDLTRYDGIGFPINTGTSDEEVVLMQYSVVQTSTPGAVKISLYNADKSVQRDIVVNNATPSYPVLADEVLKNEFAPYIKSMIIKFIEIYQGDGMASSASGFITPDILNKIKYLIGVNTVDENGQKTLKIDDTKFFEKLKTLNNGSTDWLALKAFYKGFDNSLTTIDMTPYNGNAHYGLEATAKGVKDMGSIMELLPWAHYNSFGAISLEGKEIRKNSALDQVVKDLHAGDNQFFPSMDVRELDAKNNVVLTDAVKAFYAKYSGDSYTLIKNKSAIQESSDAIEYTSGTILDLDPSNAEAKKLTDDASVIAKAAPAITDVAISNQQVANIQAIKTRIDAIKDEKVKEKNEAIDKVKAQWSSLKLTGNDQVSNLKTDDLLSVNELKALLASGSTLPAFPAKAGEIVFKLGVQPRVRTFADITDKDAKAFKVISHAADTLKVQIEFGADTAKGYMGFMPKSTSGIQFEISNIKN